MTTDREMRQEYLREFEFADLFIEQLGWDSLHSANLQVKVDDFDYAVTPIAQKSGFAVLRCGPDAEGNIPQTPVRRKIDAQVAKTYYEHIIIFTDAGQANQTWQWVKREGGTSAPRQRTFSKGQSGEIILQALESIEFAIMEEAEIGEVVSRVRQALDVERVTKSFYNRFRRELTAFEGFIEGITDQGDRDWYASLMLNRMMFIYFIQKRGFLDGDPNYLRNRLNLVRSQDGGGQFQQFYRIFLRRLFHEGLGQPESQRSSELAALLGKVPFLNGGLFDVHELERDNSEIVIPDEAFERVFDFFDAYQWHLDDRPHRADNEINPDVIGYIFEKYVNQKQMGAYYTKEDITGYITRNTVLPHLFEAARKECPIAFRPEGGIWRLLSEDPDRYIYPAVGHGMAYRYSADFDSEPILSPLNLPDHIAAGISDVSKRDGWNESAPDEYALPTETWREAVARRQRYADVRDKLSGGEVVEINDLITLNLDIERFALHAIAQSEGPELIRAFWRALTRVSILDPTCGSGAFLFAALKILEPLYTACLEGMRGFLGDLELSNRPRRPEALSDFRKILAQVEEHPSERYYILKSIVLNNLYGVDIMEEAVEICKLRLFLKLVAQLESYDQIEPLPDIDFNIRAGNTLVGFTSLDAVQRAMTVTSTGQSRQLFEEEKAALNRINESAEIASRAFDMFREQQTTLGGQVTAANKRELRDRLDELNAELDLHLAREYGVDLADATAYATWRDSHQPFHWFVEFYGIMSEGGFDVVIGNPPYLESSQTNYNVLEYAYHNTRAVHAFCIERSIDILRRSGCMSMIVPLALTSTQRMKAVQDILELDYRNAWYANYAWRPAKLFNTVNRPLSIFLITPSVIPKSFSTTYQKWTSKSRDSIMDTIIFTEVSRNRNSFWVPKLGANVEQSILHKLNSLSTSTAHFMGATEWRIYYRKTGGLYWKVFTDFAPIFSIDGRPGHSGRETSFSVTSSHQVEPLIACLSSDIFWWWYTITSNLRDLNPADIRGFPIPDSIFSDPSIRALGRVYLKDITGNSTMLVRRQRQTGITETQSFEIRKSKAIIDDIDHALAMYYNLTDEELDFIINYDIKYRMGLGR